MRRLALSNLGEVAMPAKAVLETSRSGDTVFDQRFASVVPLLDERLAHGKTMTLDGGAPVRAHADLRKAGDHLREFFCLCASASLGSDVFAQTNIQAFFCWYFSPGEDDFQGAALADDTGNRTVPPSISGTPQRATIHAEVRFLGHDPEIAPQPQLHGRLRPPVPRSPR